MHQGTSAGASVVAGLLSGRHRVGDARRPRRERCRRPGSFPGPERKHPRDATGLGLIGHHTVGRVADEQRAA